MKKIISVFILLAVAASAFAEFFIRADADLFGLDYVSRTITNPDTNQSENRDSSGKDFFYGSGIAFLWEFNSNQEKNFRPFAGGAIGVSSWGFPVTAVGGFNYNVAEFGPFAMELSPSVEIGILTELYGLIDLYSKASFDAVFLDKSRHGLFGSLGIVGQITTDLSALSRQNLKYYGISSISTHYTIGYRF